MADLFQTECTRTFRALECWTDKTKDRYFDNKLKRWIYPPTGFPDMRVNINLIHYEPELPHVCIEVKAAQGKNRTRFPFNIWREEQREWYDKYSANWPNYYWLFIMFGKNVNSKVYKRSPLLIQADKLIEIEKNSDRKSMPYELAKDTGMMLKWDTTNKVWSLEGHPFQDIFLKERS